MKRILLGFSLLLSLSLSAQSWQSKPVVRIEDAGQSFLYTFSDSSDAYINKCNVSYIVNLPNSQWVQLGYMYDGSTSRIITASYSAITQPDLASAKILSDTLNAWLRNCASSGGGGGGDVTQAAFDDSITALRSIRKVDSLYLNSTGDSTVFPINGIRYAIPRSALTFTKNSAGDSIVLTVSGVRTAVKDSIGSVTATSTTTFTNKRITARVDSTTSSATPTINTDNVDTYKLTAQAADITSFTTNLSGTPTDDQILHIIIKGTGARTISWGSSFEASTVALPTTTVGTDRLDVYFIWNTAVSKWRCGGVW